MSTYILTTQKHKKIYKTGRRQQNTDEVMSCQDNQLMISCQRCNSSLMTTQRGKY